MASRLVRSSPDRAVRVQALAGDIALCSWARRFTLTVLLFIPIFQRYSPNFQGVKLKKKKGREDIEPKMA